MPQLLMGNALWHLIMQSDWICKGVMLILLGMSIACWTIFLYKLLAIAAKKRHLRTVMQELRHIKTFEELVAFSVRNSATVSGYFFNHCLTYAKAVIENNRQKGVADLTHNDRHEIQENAYQMIDDMLQHEESLLPVLSGSAAVSPLLGLFGTVWGLVHAFVGISEKQNADIATVAPGIAEALITTLAGLMVAIPALVMFVYLSSQIKKLEQLYTHLAERFMHVLNRLTV